MVVRVAKVCCGSGAIYWQLLDLNGLKVAVAGLDDVLSEVFGMNLEKEEEIKRELLKEIMRRNYVPREAEGDYSRAIYTLYQQRYKY